MFIDPLVSGNRSVRAPIPDLSQIKLKFGVRWRTRLMPLDGITLGGEMALVHGGHSVTKLVRSPPALAQTRRIV
jgi:hypothetical protein